MKDQAKIYIIEENGDVSGIFAGTVDMRPEGYYIEYDDADGCSCIIGYSKGVATVTRTSEPAYTLILEEECPHAFELSTPFGNISASAYPVKVSSRKSKNGVTLTLVYDLALGANKFRHTLKLKAEIVDD